MAVRSDRIGIPIGLHERRVLAWLRSSASDALAGRRVWCAASLSGGRAAGRRLWHLLKDDLEVDSLAVEAPEPSARLAGQLDAMLAGVSAPRSLGAAARAAYARGRDAARARRQALAWISLLGDIVEEDRADRVGGTIQARPVVAAR